MTREAQASGIGRATAPSELGNSGTQSDLSAPPSQQTAGVSWRPIESAPRDGTSVLLLVGETVHQGSYDGPSDGAVYAMTAGRYNWFSETTLQTQHDAVVTHWMPLPPPPSSREETRPAFTRNPTGCAADRDGDCSWAGCPQLRDNEPTATGRHCPRDTSSQEEGR